MFNNWFIFWRVVCSCGLRLDHTKGHSVECLLSRCILLSPPEITYCYQHLDIFYMLHMYTFLYSFYTNGNLYSFPKLLFSLVDFGVHFLSVHKEIPYFYDNPVFHWMIYWDSFLKIFHTVFKVYAPFTVIAKCWLYS